MNFKMFGTINPDFSGETKLSGSHHTIAFYRKGIGHFMPDGMMIGILCRTQAILLVRNLFVI